MTRASRAWKTLLALYDGPALMTATINAHSHSSQSQSCHTNNNTLAQPCDNGECRHTSATHMYLYMTYNTMLYPCSMVVLQQYVVCTYMYVVAALPSKLRKIQAGFYSLFNHHWQSFLKPDLSLCTRYNNTDNYNRIMFVCLPFSALFLSPLIARSRCSIRTMARGWTSATSFNHVT